MGGQSVLRVRLQEFMSQLDSTFFVFIFPILQATTTTAGSTLVVLRVKVAPRSHTLQRTAVKSGLENTSKRWHVSLFRNCSTAARLVSLLTSASAASGLHLNDDTTLALNQSLRTSSGSRFISLTGSSSAIASLDAAHGPRDDHLARHALWTPLQEFTLQMLPNLAPSFRNATLETRPRRSKRSARATRKTRYKRVFVSPYTRPEATANANTHAKGFTGLDARVSLVSNGAETRLGTKR